MALLLLWLPTQPVATDMADAREDVSIGQTELGVGAAFDGSHVWYTLGYVPDPTIYRIDPTTETVVATLDMVTLTGGRNLVPGGLAWDPNQEHLWVATLLDLDAAEEESLGEGEIFEIDPVAETVVSSFPTRQITEAEEPLYGIIDGLAFDPRSDTLWFSPLESVHVYEVTTEGTLVSSFVLPFSPEVWNAGLTFDGNHLWLSLRTGGVTRDALPGFVEVILVEFTTDGVFLGGVVSEVGPIGSEDLAFDPVTFAPSCVVWLTSIENPLSTFDVPCPLQVKATMHPGESLHLQKEVTLDAFSAGGFEEEFTDVWWEVDCETPGITVTLQPEVYNDVAVGTTLAFDEWIEVPSETVPGEYHCTVTFLANTYPEAGAPFEQQFIWITVEAEPREPEPLLEVPVDIKPTSCRNPLNVKSKGVLPVAILGFDSFDVSQIDITTILLEGVAPLRWSMEDVATPYEPFTGKEDAFDCTEAGPDDYVDLTLKFSRQAIIAALGEVSDGDVLVLTLSGKLLDGTEFTGEDVVVILKKGKK